MCSIRHDLEMYILKLYNTCYQLYVIRRISKIIIQFCLRACNLWMTVLPITGISHLSMDERVPAFFSFFLHNSLYQLVFDFYAIILLFLQRRTVFSHVHTVNFKFRFQFFFAFSFIHFNSISSSNLSYSISTSIIFYFWVYPILFPVLSYSISGSILFYFWIHPLLFLGLSHSISFNSIHLNFHFYPFLFPVLFCFFRIYLILFLVQILFYFRFYLILFPSLSYYISCSILYYFQFYFILFPVLSYSFPVPYSSISGQILFYFQFYYILFYFWFFDTISSSILFYFQFYPFLFPVLFYSIRVRYSTDMTF